MLKSALERAVPRTLWTIDRREKACVPPQRVKVFGKRVTVTPPIACTIVGKVTRGALRLRGEGQEIVVDVPLHAVTSARDVRSEEHTSELQSIMRILYAVFCLLKN